MNEENLNERLLSNEPDRRDNDDDKVPPGKLAKMATSNCTIGILFTFAVVLLAGGISVGIYWMTIYNDILLKQLILTPTSTSYDMWKEIPIPMYLYLYLYNWTNPHEFTASSTVKPNFVQMGPYTFREEHIKVNKIWNENGTITFQQKRVWHFEESMSNGTLDDEITNLNVIAVTTADMVRDEPWLVRIMVDRLMRSLNQTLVVTKTARELLFDGYDDELLDFVKRLNLTAIHLPFDKFGWFYARNGSDTYDGVFNMHTGVLNVSHLGLVDRWNYVDRTDFWHGECSVIKGSTGELWPPQSNTESIEIFAPDICTSLILSRTNDTNFSEITGHTFVADSATFDNGSNVPSRACYCNRSPCQPSGTLDVSQCKFGAPAFISLPHFLLADESYVDDITGMEPQDDEYSFSMTLEPTTGIPLNVRAQMQINILVEPINTITILTGIPNKRTFIPILWFKQEANLTPEIARRMKLLLILPTLGEATFIAIACIGFTLALTAIYLCYCARSKKGENQLLIEPNNDSDAPRADPVTT